MKPPLTDEEFWDLVDRYEKKEISADEALDVILEHTKNYEVATADFSLLVTRTITKEELQKIKEHVYEKNNKGNTSPNKGKNRERGK